MPVIHRTVPNNRPSSPLRRIPGNIYSMAMPDQRVIRGRGATMNPANRFVQIHLERDPDFDPAEDLAPGTQVYKDEAASIIAYNDSPDVGFSASINPYRG